MVDYFFTSDTHFNHEAICGLAGRPFSSVEEMNEALIDKWNAIINRKDIVYHLGDFAFKNHGTIRNRLNGKIILIKGNHDKMSQQSYRDLFTEVRDVYYVKLFTPHIFLSHYAMRTWRGRRDNEDASWHLFGHSHGRLAPYEHSLDVGVDFWNYSPVPYDEICRVMSNIHKCMDCGKVLEHDWYIICPNCWSKRGS